MSKKVEKIKVKNKKVEEIKIKKDAGHTIESDGLKVTVHCPDGAHCYHKDGIFVISKKELRDLVLYSQYGGANKE